MESLPFKEREVCIEKIYTVWASRVGTERQKNPVTAIDSPPGGGKTRLLKELGRKKYLFLCKDEELQKTLQQSIPIMITLNNSTSYNPSRERDFTFSLAARALFR
jgi:hypothetical protein